MLPQSVSSLDENKRSFVQKFTIHFLPFSSSLLTNFVHMIQKVIIKYNTFTEQAQNENNTGFFICLDVTRSILYL